jgi:thiamine-monophosphate kinase
MSILQDKNQPKTPISELGEFKLIEHITKDFVAKNSNTVYGVGDDCAVIDCGDKYQLVSTDMLIEGVHFDLSYTPLKHLGYKLVAVNVSDVCAMNGVAQQITVSISISNRFTLESIEELYLGIRLACQAFNVDLVGGDTTSSMSGICISVTAIGQVDKDKIVYRKGAKENDLLVVSGDLGSAYLGLQVLEREKQVFQANPKMQPDLHNNDYVLERQLKPEARIDVVKVLAKKNIVPTSMIDVSDGLSSELLHICKSSKVGCTIYEDKLPIDFAAMTSAEEFKISAATCALNGGEDYELLFSISQNDYEKLKDDPDFTIIGHITDSSSGTAFIAKDNSRHDLIAQGWNSFD